MGLHDQVSSSIPIRLKSSPGLACLLYASEGPIGVRKHYLEQVRRCHADLSQ